MDGRTPLGRGLCWHAQQGRGGGGGSLAGARAGPLSLAGGQQRPDEKHVQK